MFLQKRTLLLINKADLLTTYQRKIWAKYLNSKSIDFIYFSANRERIKQEIALAKERAAKLEADDFEQDDYVLNKPLHFDSENEEE